MNSLQLLDLGATTLLHSLLWPAAIALLLRFKRDLRPEHRAGVLKLALFGALITGPWASLRGGPSLLDPSLLNDVAGDPARTAQLDLAELAAADAPEPIESEPQPLLISVMSFEELVRSGTIEFEVDGEPQVESVDVGPSAFAGTAETKFTQSEPVAPAEPFELAEEAPAPVASVDVLQPARTPEPATAAFGFADLLPWIAQATLAAFALLVFAASWRQWRARRWLGQLPASEREEELFLAERLEALERQAGRDPKVRLIVSPALPVPCTWGLVKPVIGVPERALDELDAGELDAVLAHELAHVARRDAWWHAGVQGLLAVAPLHWPARRAARALARATELSADAWAARLTGSPLDLAGGLTKVAGWTRGARVPVPALAMAAQPSLVRERVEALLDRRPLVAPRELAPFALGALLLAGASAPRVWAEDRAALPGLDPAPFETVEGLEWNDDAHVEATVRVEVSLSEELGLAAWIADQRAAAKATLIELEATAELAAERHPEVLPRLDALKGRVLRHLEHLNTATQLVAEDDHPEPRTRRR